jgi:hypothetical protein
MPAGYQSKPYQPDPNDAKTQAELVACVGGKNTSAEQTGEAHSADYFLDASQISSSATSFKSEKDVAADVAILRSPKISACYTKLFKNTVAGALPAGAVIKNVAIAITPRVPTQPANVVGNGAGKIVVTTQGQTVPLYVNVAFITGHLIEAEVEFLDVGAPVAADTRSELIAKVAARAAAA